MTLLTLTWSGQAGRQNTGVQISIQHSLRQLLSGGINGEGEDEFANREPAGNVGDEDHMPDDPLPNIPEEDESWRVECVEWGFF